MWKTETPEPLPQRSVIETGNVKVAVSPAHNDPRRWQYFTMSFGKHSDKAHSECLKTWPLEAIRMAREELGRLEAKLDRED